MWLRLILPRKMKVKCIKCLISILITANSPNYCVIGAGRLAIWAEIKKKKRFKREQTVGNLLGEVMKETKFPTRMVTSPSQSQVLEQNDQHDCYCAGIFKMKKKKPPQPNINQLYCSFISNPRNNWFLYPISFHSHVSEILPLPDHYGYSFRHDQVD